MAKKNEKKTADKDATKQTSKDAGKAPKGGRKK